MMSEMDEDEGVFIGQNPEGGIDRFRVSRYHSNTHGWEPMLILIAGRHVTE